MAKEKKKVAAKKAEKNPQKVAKPVEKRVEQKPAAKKPSLVARVAERVLPKYPGEEVVMKKTLPVAGAAPLASAAGTALPTRQTLGVYDVIVHPLITEKAVQMIEAENKLCFIVNKRASRTDVKRAVEELYKVKVDKVNILKDMQARKRAFVKINKAHKAEEIATKLGVL